MKQQILKIIPKATDKSSRNSIKKIVMSLHRSILM